VLKGGDKEMSALSKPSFSKQHEQEIDCEKFARFLQDKNPLTLIDQLQAYPIVQFHHEAIDQIAVGLDIWDESNTTNKNSHQALRLFAAHALCSTTMNGW
jgi:hypothetical protein